MTDHRLGRRALLKATGAGMLAVGAGGVAQATDEDDAETEDATEIQDWHDLDAVRDDLDGEYVLVADLDSDTDGYDEHVGDPEGGFEPIGDGDLDGDVEFRGTFDGNGNEIADPSIDRPDEDDVGLFGAIRQLNDEEGRIENVTPTNAAVTGRLRVGGLVGSNRGEIASAAAEGDVTGVGLVGGLVGKNFVGNKIASSAAEADVTGDSVVGGLVRWNAGEVVESSAVGDVTGGADRTCPDVAGVRPAPWRRQAVPGARAAGPVLGAAGDGHRTHVS